VASRLRRRVPVPAPRHPGPPLGRRGNHSAAPSGTARAAGGRHGRARRPPLRVRRQTGAAAPEGSGQRTGDQAAGPAWAGGGFAASPSATSTRRTAWGSVSGQRRRGIRRPEGQGPAAARRPARAPRGAGAPRAARSRRPGSAAAPRSDRTPAPQSRTPAAVAEPTASASRNFTTRPRRGPASGGDWRGAGDEAMAPQHSAPLLAPMPHFDSHTRR
jgi:hypothetical protein